MFHVKLARGRGYAASHGAMQVVAVGGETRAGAAMPARRSHKRSPSPTIGLVLQASAFVTEVRQKEGIRATASRTRRSHGPAVRPHAAAATVVSRETSVSLSNTRAVGRVAQAGITTAPVRAKSVFLGEDGCASPKWIGSRRTDPLTEVARAVEGHGPHLRGGTSPVLAPALN
jgi:hypothetical protein